MPPIPGRSSYKFASPETWELIRTAYMRGESGPSLARRFNVGLWNLYKKAMDEGWSRRQCALREARGEAALGNLSSYPAAAAADPSEASGPGETWTSLKDPPPPSMQRWPHPLPGMGPMRRPAWEPPAGYGPMPPHLVPPVPRPPEPSEDEADPPSAAPSAGEAAGQAIAAAARAVAAGRYDEAERLGRLATTLQKLAGQTSSSGARAGAKGGDRIHSAPDDDADEDLELGDRLLNCTAKTCAMERVTEVLKARLDALYSDMQGPEGEDLEDWTDMAIGMGVKGDPDVMRLGEVYRAKGMGDIRKEIIALCDPSPEVDRSPGFSPYRTR